MERGISRREFLKKSALFLGASLSAAVPSSCRTEEIRPTPTPSSTRKEVLNQYSFMSKEKQRMVLESLNPLSSPLNKKTQSDLIFLTSSEVGNQQFPGWVDRSSFPLLIAYDSSGDSATEFIIQNNDTPQGAFIYPNPSKDVVQEVESAFFWLTLGTAGTPSNQALVEGLTLSHTYWQMLGGIQIADALPAMFKQKGTVIMDTQGNEITDPERLKNIGAAILFKELSVSANQQNPGNIFKIFITFPNFLMAEASILAPENERYPYGETVAEIVNIVKANPFVDQTLSREVANWLRADTYLPPVDLLGWFFTVNFKPAVDDVFQISH